MTAASPRADAWGFLAALYAQPPDAPTLARMARFVPPQDADMAHPLTESLATLESDADFAARAECLAIEHTRLFGGLREGYGPPPPYESLWREGRLMGESTVAVSEAYHEAGYQPGGDWMPFDHLVEELRFMATLCHTEATAHRPKDADWAREAQARFLRDHLSMWLPAYCEAVAADTQEAFFRALAAATAEALDEDVARLTEAAQV